MKDLAEIHAYDSARENAHAEIAAGQFMTLAAYLASRVLKRKKRRLRARTPGPVGTSAA
jgi:hypothetical protein